MKVKMMIEALEKQNPEADVKLHDHRGETALFVVALANNPNKIWIESASDIDVGAELEAQFKHASETQMDELDFYMELVDRGFTMDDIRKYMGEETARHTQKFCEEHGLI